MKLHTKLLIALILGAVVGAVLHPYAEAAWVAATVANVLRPLGQIFLRAIFMIVVPMVFAALVIGVYELRQGPGLPGVAGRTLLFTALLSATSVLVGLVLVNVIRPGDGLELGALLPQASSVDQLRANAAAARSLSDTIVELVPRNPLESAVRALDGEMLPFMVFTLVFGAALSYVATPDGGRSAFLRILDEVFEACLKIIHVVMKFAPVAVFAIVATTAITFGTAIFGALILYVLTVTLGLLIQQFGTYALFLWTVARRSPL